MHFMRVTKTKHCIGTGIYTLIGWVGSTSNTIIAGNVAQTKTTCKRDNSYFTPLTAF